jgi:hypothetical protein
MLPYSEGKYINEEWMNTQLTVKIRRWFAYMEKDPNFRLNFSARMEKQVTELLF